MSPDPSPSSCVWNVRVIVSPEEGDEHLWYTSARFGYAHPMEEAQVRADPTVADWVAGRVIDDVYLVHREQGLTSSGQEG